MISNFLQNDINTFIGNRELSIAIVITINKDQPHCGIIYKLDNGTFVLHLAHHCLLINDSDLSNFKKYYWVIPNIPSENQLAFSTLCQNIANNSSSGKIKYGFFYNNGKFCQDGKLELSEKEIGLTCATFIMAIFCTYGMKLIDTETWEKREDDAIWHEKIIKILKEYKEKLGISDEHIANLEKEKDCARYRPQEVASSTIYEVKPHSPNSDIIANGEKLATHIIDTIGEKTQKLEQEK